MDVARVFTEQALRALPKAGRKPTFDGAPLLYDLNALRILPPIRPKRVLCLARNYEGHRPEMALRLPLPEGNEHPLVFMKPNSAIQGAYDPVALSDGVVELDAEVELAVIIGVGGKAIPASRAMDHVAGYTVINDLGDGSGWPTGAGKQVDWFRMKGQDGFAPLGPWLLLGDAQQDPYDWRLRLWVNGRVRQDGETKSMKLRINEQIAYLSQVVTLQTGDVIATGSPPDLGTRRPRWLKEGDLVEAEVGPLGKQHFRIVDERRRGYRRLS